MFDHRIGTPPPGGGTGEDAPTRLVGSHSPVDVVLHNLRSISPAVCEVEVLVAFADPVADLGRTRRDTLDDVPLLSPAVVVELIGVIGARATVRAEYEIVAR